MSDTELATKIHSPALHSDLIHRLKLIQIPRGFVAAVLGLLALGLVAIVTHKS